MGSPTDAPTVASLATASRPASLRNATQWAPPSAASDAAPARPRDPSSAALPGAGRRTADCASGWRCDSTLLEHTERPQATTVLIEKQAHRLHLAVGDTIVKSYRVALGWGGAGPKQYEGDGRTPVGTYRITGRLPTSPWHLFLAVSYPNLDDNKRYATLKANGRVPFGAGVGFGIGIHGRRADMRDGEHKLQDWTLGCIALDNPEIEEVAALVPNGATVIITD
jgi:lipoprotein-anchoring transpeptidase ErfK/SrfK